MVKREVSWKFVACYLASVWQLKSPPKHPKAQPDIYQAVLKLLCGSFETPPVKHVHNIRHLTAFLIWANELLKVRAQTMFDRVADDPRSPSPRELSSSAEYAPTGDHTDLKTNKYMYNRP